MRLIQNNSAVFYIALTAHFITAMICGALCSSDGQYHPKPIFIPLLLLSAMIASAWCVYFIPWEPLNRLPYALGLSLINGIVVKFIAGPGPHGLFEEPVIILTLFAVVGVPTYILCWLAALGSKFVFDRIRVFIDKNHCAKCGHDLTGGVNNRCPKCGTSIDKQSTV